MNQTNDLIEHVRAVWESAECLCGEDEVEQAITQLAAQISERLSLTNPIIMCLMNGGLVFCGKLIPQLLFPLQVDYVHVTRYQNDVVGSSTIEWRASPQIDVSGRTVIVVDDILDQGCTLYETVAALRAQGAAEVYTAVLIDKQHDRKFKPGWRADFTALEIEDRYLFGYGMDYKGYLRNAPGIYAVQGL